MPRAKRENPRDLIVDGLWEHLDDSEENAQTGEVTVTLTTEQAQSIWKLYWRLGGKYRSGLEDCGWSPHPTISTQEKP